MFQKVNNMDLEYFDLYIKYYNSEKEVLWSRCLPWCELMLNIEFFRKFNKTDLEIFGKSRIEYIRFE